MAGAAPEGSQYVAKMTKLLDADDLAEEFFKSYDEVYDSLDSMSLQQNLLRGIYAYGFSGARRQFTSYDEVYDSFDSLGLQENLSRGIHAYFGNSDCEIQSRLKSAEVIKKKSTPINLKKMLKPEREIAIERGIAIERLAAKRKETKKDKVLLKASERKQRRIKYCC